MRAFLTAEDRNFYEHGGIDVDGGWARALAATWSTLARGRRLQGGSTITQQVAKNVLLTNDVSYRPQDQGSHPRLPAWRKPCPRTASSSSI